MGITKSDFFTDEQNELAQVFKALAHPARIAIIQYLVKVDACICGDIVNELPLAQPTISQHLKELKQVNLIQGTVEGKSICYCINAKMIQKLEYYLGSINQSLTNKCC